MRQAVWLLTLVGFITSCGEQQGGQNTIDSTKVETEVNLWDIPAKNRLEEVVPDGYILEAFSFADFNSDSIEDAVIMYNEEDYTRDTPLVMVAWGEADGSFTGGESNAEVVMPIMDDVFETRISLATSGKYFSIEHVGDYMDKEWSRIITFGYRGDGKFYLHKDGGKHYRSTHDKVLTKQDFGEVPFSSFTHKMNPQVHNKINLPEVRSKLATLSVTYIPQMVEALDFCASQPRSCHSYYSFSYFRQYYYALQTRLTLKGIEEAVGMPVFYPGIHDNGMDFNNDENFGHYNPAFVSFLSDAIDSVVHDPLASTAARYLYYNRLQEDVKSACIVYYLRNHLSLYELNIDPENRESMDSIQVELAEGYDYKRKMLVYDAGMLLTGDGYVFSNLDLWWERREQDGTADMYFEIVRKLLAYYDEGFISEDVDIP